MKNIHKYFPGVHALKGVDFSLVENEIHALVGENGAGKSTLIKILSGFYRPEEGAIHVEGESIELNDPSAAKTAGIGVIYQEFNLVSQLCVAENIFLGNEITKGVLKKVSKKELYERSREILDKLHLTIDPRDRVGDLGVGEQQMVEICKALVTKPKILIMDEPTAALSRNEIQELFRLINNLKKQGVSIIYISHRLEEVYEIADRITVLRDGKSIETSDIRDITEQKIVQLMTGKEMKTFFPKKDYKKEFFNKILSVKNLNNEKLNDISFDLHTGEILGIYGMMGSGRTELVRALFGADFSSFKEYIINGNKITSINPMKAIKKGIGYLTEDRKDQGLFLDLNIKTNFSITGLSKFSNALRIRNREENLAVRDYIDKLSIRCSSVTQLVKNLSGGNQQKVLFARWLNIDPQILILDEPTRGIDVGAKSEIYELLRKLSGESYGIILISSELPEICALSDRVLILKNGTITGEVSGENLNQQNILQLAV